MRPSENESRQSRREYLLHMKTQASSLSPEETSMLIERDMNEFSWSSAGVERAAESRSVTGEMRREPAPALQLQLQPAIGTDASPRAGAAPHLLRRGR